MSRCDFESKLWSNPTEKKKRRIAFTITSWSPWQPWLSLHERLTECDLQWSFLWSRSWRLGIPANTMAGFSINMIICCRLPGRWTSTASGERLELYMRQQRGWVTTEYRRMHMAADVHTPPHRRVEVPDINTKKMMLAMCLQQSELSLFTPS